MTYGKTRAGRSWHRIVFENEGKARCGRVVEGERRNDLPLHEKWCETCLRLTVAEKD